MELSQGCGMIFKKINILYFSIGLLYLCIMQIGSAYLLFPEVNPAYSGFNDDRLYIDMVNVELELLDSAFSINSFYWHLARFFLILFEGWAPFFLKLFNLVVLVWAFDISMRIVFMRVDSTIGRISGLRYMIFFIPFLPTIWVLSKEYIVLICVVGFLYCINSYVVNRNITHLVAGLALFLMLTSTRYVYAAVMLFLLFLVLIRLRKYKILLASFAFILVLIVFNLEFIYEFSQIYVYNRFIEMYNEGKNYGLKAASGSLSEMYSGNFIYSVFQYLTAPIPSVDYFLYNSYFMISPLLVVGLIVALLNSKIGKEVGGYVLLALLLISALIVSINFGSNFRYKLSPAWLSSIFICLVANKKRRIYHAALYMLATCFVIIVVLSIGRI